MGHLTITLPNGIIIEGCTLDDVKYLLNTTSTTKCYTKNKHASDEVILNWLGNKCFTSARTVAQHLRIYKGAGGTERAAQKLESMVDRKLLKAHEVIASNGHLITLYSINNGIKN